MIRKKKRSSNASMAANTPENELPLDRGGTYEPAISPEEAAEREKIVAEWVAQAERIATVSNSERAKAIVSIFKEAGLVRPYNDRSFHVIRQPVAVDGLLFMPLIIGDENRGERYAGHLDIDKLDAVASYSPASRIIAFQGLSETSDIFKGIILLHEGNHALEDMQNPQAGLHSWYDPVQYTKGEVRTHEFENELLLAVGGQKYARFIDKYAQEFASEIKPVAGGSFEVMSFAGYRPELDDIFGPALSDFEKVARQSGVWTHAAFLAFERTMGPDAPTTKLDLLMSIYDNIGALPGN